MSRRLRLDAELVRRGLAQSREHASELIEQGIVTVAGSIATKSATGVTTDQAIRVTEEQGPRFASRGAYKLLGALEVFKPQGLTISGKRCLDAGASTGGFTDVLLREGAARVIAVDVGYGQLVWALQSDDRVEIHDRTNIRSITTELIGGPVDLVVSDLSFISLTVVMAAVLSVCTNEGDVVLMIKPQFEVGKDRLGKNGVVREPALHIESVERVCASAHSLGWGTHGLAASPLPGPAGNVEYFCWLRHGDEVVQRKHIEHVVAHGPLASRAS